MNDLNKADCGDGLGKTVSGKPINVNARHKDHKTFSKDDHKDAMLAHKLAHQKCRDEYSKTKTYHRDAWGDRMVPVLTDGDVKKRRKLDKKMDHHRSQARLHEEMHEKMGGNVNVTLSMTKDTNMFKSGEMPESLVQTVNHSDESLAKSIEDGEHTPSTISRSATDTLLKSDQSFDLTKAAGELKADQAAETDDVKDDTEESITKEQMGKSVDSALDDLTKGCGSKKRKKKMKEEYDSMKSDCQPVFDEIAGAFKADELEKAYEGFNKLAGKLEGKVNNPRAVTASIGRKRYGSGAFQAAAAAGRKMGQKSMNEVGSALDDLTKAYGSENLVNTHAESHHADVDKQVIAWLTTAEAINPYDESHNQSPQKIDPARPGYLQERSMVTRIR
jgi:hypothetical protein